MGKGLPRSLSRGPKIRQEIVKETTTFETTVSVSAVGTAAGGGTSILVGLPEGNFFLIAAISYVQFSGSGSDPNLTSDWEGDYAMGTLALDGVALEAAGETNIIISTAINAATNQVSPDVRGQRINQVIDNTDGNLVVNLNVLIDAADITDDTSVNLDVVGRLTLLYSVLDDD